MSLPPSLPSPSPPPPLTTLDDPLLSPSMTRGRRKDLTIPPSRALLQQRDYRARKARYLADLEERVRLTEEENARLKDEVDLLTAKLHAAGQSVTQRNSPSPEVVRLLATPGVTLTNLRPLLRKQAAATSDLMHHLSSAAASIARFQQVALHPPPEPSSSMLQLPPIHNHIPTSLATPSFTPSPLPQPHRRLPSPRGSSRIELPPLHSLHRDLFRPDHPGHPYGHPPRHTKPIDPGPPPSSYSESECCGGYLDCNDLVDDKDDGLSGDDDPRDPRDPRSRLAQRMSDLRSTTSSSGPEDGPSTRMSR
ncbi:uncharacterized protein FIBRA_03176 [Fibroporia radiculosa]|uniref:BZIP domain-containing protein n=1 Tax=Fibroporia radiculosa TaxID=599839 RepID=J4G4F7_9APHY|nr:uncharacterized protein FIBRA_03176 [Fibroporia radiculosa]CCM01128.1 predicted protein [Fibroporia radiculosa]